RKSERTLSSIMARKRGQVQSGNRESGERWGESRIEDRGSTYQTAMTLNPRSSRALRIEDSAPITGFLPLLEVDHGSGVPEGGIGSRIASHGSIPEGGCPAAAILT